MTLALISGLFIGSVLGFVGAGGAMVSVPILLYLFHFTPLAATTAALAIVAAAAFSGVIPKMLTRDVLYFEAITIWALGLTTNIGGALLAKHLSDSFITVGFAAIMVLAASSMLRPIKLGADEKRISLPSLVLLSLFIGAMTGIFGVGGGFLAIPVLANYYNTPQSKAAGTSLFIITLNCLTSLFAHHGSWHLVEWRYPIEIAFVAVLTSTTASHLSSKAPTSLLRKSFAYLLFALAIFTVLRNWV